MITNKRVYTIRNLWILMKIDVFCGCESVTIFRQQTMDNMSEHIFAEIISKRPRSFASSSRCQRHRMARATARRAARHQAVASSRAYSRRGAKRKPYTYVFTSIRPRLQNFCAADAQRPPPHRPHLGYAGLAPQPTYLGRAGPKQLGRAVKASLICANTFREHASV